MAGIPKATSDCCIPSSSSKRGDETGATPSAEPEGMRPEWPAAAPTEHLLATGHRSRRPRNPPRGHWQDGQKNTSITAIATSPGAAPPLSPTMGSLILIPQAVYHGPYMCSTQPTYTNTWTPEIQATLYDTSKERLQLLLIVKRLFIGIRSLGCGRL